MRSLFIEVPLTLNNQKVKYSIKNIVLALNLLGDRDIPLLEKKSILLNKDLSKIYQCILKVPIPYKDRLKVLYDEKLREEAQIIFSSFLSPKMKARAFNDKKFWIDAHGILKTTFSDKMKERILLGSESKIFRRYIKYLRVVDPKVLKARELIGLKTAEDTLKHLKLADTSGKTTGCGCKLCIARNEEYKNSKLLQSYRLEALKLDRIDTIFNGNGKDNSQLLDPFKCEFFNNSNTVYIKKLKKSSQKDDKGNIIFMDMRKNIVGKDIPIREELLFGKEGRILVNTRIDKNKAHLHKLIQEKFGRESNLKNAIEQLKVLTVLPI